MSGHSKFANIKHKKEKNDAAKGKIFTIKRLILMILKPYLLRIVPALFLQPQNPEQIKNHTKKLMITVHFPAEIIKSSAIITKKPRSNTAPGQFFIQLLLILQDYEVYQHRSLYLLPCNTQKPALEQLLMME